MEVVEVVDNSPLEELTSPANSPNEFLESLDDSDVQSTVFHDPYEDMPTLDNMSEYQLNLRRTSVHNRYNCAESVFVTLARFLFPTTDEIMLPGISLDAIFSKCKYLVLRCPESGTNSSRNLTAEEEEFLDQFCLKSIDSIDMSEWEQLRDIYVGRSSWFVRQSGGQNEDQSGNVSVKKLRAGIKLLHHLPPCRSLFQVRSMMYNYISVVNLGRPCDEPWIPAKPCSEPETTASLRRSARLQRRSDSIVDALKDLLDREANSRGNNDLSKIDDWPFDIDQVDSGFDESHVDTEVSIFQAGTLERQLSRDHFQYPIEQLIFDTGLTQKEEEAFEGLENQLEMYFAIPKRKRYRTKAARTMEAIQRYAALAKRFVLPTSSMADAIAKRRGSDGEIIDRRILRSSRSASIASEISELEIISEEKAILTSLKIPNEYASIPTPQFLAEHEGKYLHEKDFIVGYDETAEVPVERALTEWAFDMMPSSSNIADCLKESCALGCVCDSLQSHAIQREHCGKVKCMFGCVCVAKAPKVTSNVQETRDVRLSLRSRVQKWKRPIIENTIPKKKLKRTLSVVADEEKKRKRFRSKGVTNKTFDGEDNYMGDIDRAEVSSDDGAGSYTCSAEIAVLPVGETENNDEVLGISPIPVDVHDDAYMTDESYLDNSLVRILDRELEAEDMEVDNVEVGCWSPRPDSLEANQMPIGRTRRLYNPLPLEIVNAERDERTFCVVSVEEDHNVLIHWREDCHLPKVTEASSVEVSPIHFSNILTLPLPSLHDTFYLFKLPAETDGDIQLHILEMRFLLPLDKLQAARLRARDTRTRQIRLLSSDKERLYAAAGHPCEIYVFPSIPQLLVIGPYPVGPSEDAEWTQDSDSQSPLLQTENSSLVKPTEISVESDASGQWNGSGEMIPKAYLEKCLDDYMIEFPSIGDWAL